VLASFLLAQVEAAAPSSGAAPRLAAPQAAEVALPAAAVPAPAARPGAALEVEVGGAARPVSPEVPSDMRGIVGSRGAKASVTVVRPSHLVTLFHGGGRVSGLGEASVLVERRAPVVWETSGRDSQRETARREELEQRFSPLPAFPPSCLSSVFIVSPRMRRSAAVVLDPVLSRGAALPNAAAALAPLSVCPSCRPPADGAQRASPPRWVAPG
jgi:hypothetical protein